METAFKLGLFLAILTVSLAGEVSPHEIQCYKCVSSVQTDCEKYDEGVFEKNGFKVNCSADTQKPNSLGYEDAKPVGCRKIVQEVDGKERIVRQCAFSGDNVQGLKRTGNKGVRLFYYQCTDKFCNGAVSRWSVGQLFAVAIPLGMALVLRSQMM